MRPLEVAARLDLLLAGRHTQALRSIELSVQRPHHPLSGAARSLHSGGLGWALRTRGRQNVARFAIEDPAQIDVRAPTRNAHAQVRLPSEPGRVYLIEFEVAGAGDGRFVVIDALAGIEHRFTPELEHVALLHRNPDSAPAVAVFVLLAAFPRWCLQRCVITNLD